MPRFPAAFSRRKSAAADTIENVPVTGGSSFRVLDRSEMTGGRGSRNFDTNSAPRPPVKSLSTPTTTTLEVRPEDDNMFADIKINRGSGSSNTTKATSTDDSSRHSNASTAPSSADLGGQQPSQPQQDDWKHANKKQHGDVPIPPIPKSSTTGSFLRHAGRTFSFGGQKKHSVLSPSLEERPPATPPTQTESDTYGNRERAATASTVTTATPPKVDEGFTLDLGGDFGSMLSTFDNKRASMATVREDGTGRPALAPRSLTGNRLNQPNPIHVDRDAKVEASPYSWSSHHSTDQLLNQATTMASPTNENAPPVPRHASPTSARTPTVAPPIHTASLPQLSSSDSGLKRSSAIFSRRRSTVDYPAEPEDEDTVLLKDSFSTVNKFLTGGSSVSKLGPSRFRRNDDSSPSGYRQVPTDATPPQYDPRPATEEDNLFENSTLHSSRITPRFVSTKASPPQNKVMTPAQFERYRKDKERETRKSVDERRLAEKDDEDEDNYEEDDDEDEAEKSRQAAKQRRKQEAHMAVYRQQMMKVTGEAAAGTSAHTSIQASMSTPNLSSLGAPNRTATPSGPSPQGGSEGSDDDEEVPLAILAAHGFPNKNRPPTRLSTMMSNPNLRSAAAPSFQRPGSAMGDAPPNGGGNGRLPPFARNLPQDPYGLVSPPIREPLQFGVGVTLPASQAGISAPPGGLVGVIANEERSRAMRRGSPALEAGNKPLPSNLMGDASFNPMAGIPPQMMYPNMMGMPQQPMLTPGDQAQIQMTQQMQQFMQMQMQFMQMMAGNNANNGMQRPMSQMSGASGMHPGMGMGMGMGPGRGMGMGPDAMRHSFVDNGSVADMPQQRVDHMRTMSMVQPSSASWIQPLNNTGFAPSIRIQGTNGYAASIAPSERSNIGLPGRYRPVSHMPAASQSSDLRKSMIMSGALGTPGADPGGNSGSASPTEGNPRNSTGSATNPNAWDHTRKQTNRSPLNKATTAEDDEDDEVGWAAMKAKREKKRSMWRSKKPAGSEISALIS